MRLARIFTHHPGRTTSLSEELQQQGYQVEVRSPDQTHLAPADLEIEFEICDRADVLERAASLAEEFHADVAVAPGVLKPVEQPRTGPLPVKADTPPEPTQAAAPVKPLIEAAPVEAAPVPSLSEVAAPMEPLVEAAPARPPIEAAAPVTTGPLPVAGGLHEENWVAADREHEFEAAFSASRYVPVEQLPPMVENPPMIENPVVEYAPLPPVAFAEEPAAMRVGPVVSGVEKPAIVEPARPDPVPYLAQLTPFSAPSQHAPEVVEGRMNPLPAQEARSVAPESFAPENFTHENLVQANAAPESVRQEKQARARDANRGIAPPVAAREQSGESVLSTAMAGIKSMKASTAESFREWLQEHRKRAQVRSAEARAARVARMLDLEQRNAEAQQRAAELEAAREAASARLVELVRQRDPGWQEENAARELREERMREERSGQRRAGDELWGGERKATPPRPPQRTPVESLRHASIERIQSRPRRPMSPQLRAVLTGAAAVSVLFVIGIVLGELYPRTPITHTASHSSGVTVPIGGPNALTGSPNTPTRGVTLKAGEPAQPTAPQPSPSTAAKSQPTTKPSPRLTQGRHAAGRQDEDKIGDDVVVRHLSSPAPAEKPKQSGQQAGLKRFSDLN